MKRVTVKNLNGVKTHGADLADPTDWIQECESNGYWGNPGEYTVEIEDISFDHEMDLCIQARIAEYPDLGAFLNAFFDGGQEAIDELNQKRLEVKAKYPKPVKEQ